ncbi:hypothetical protein PMAYCL1PPCAC_16559, partial [Pristionchus mayeri]
LFHSTAQHRLILENSRTATNRLVERCGVRENALQKDTITFEARDARAVLKLDRLVQGVDEGLDSSLDVRLPCKIVSKANCCDCSRCSQCYRCTIV